MEKLSLMPGFSIRRAGLMEKSAAGARERRKVGRTILADHEACFKIAICDLIHSSLKV